MKTLIVCDIQPEYDTSFSINYFTQCLNKTRIKNTYIFIMDMMNDELELYENKMLN